jgi:hypothetical protein
VISKYIFNLFTLFNSIHDAHFFCLLSLSSWHDNSFDRRGHKRQVNTVLVNLLRLHYPGVVVTGANHCVPVTGCCDNALSLDGRYGNAQGVMKIAFWVSSYIFITSGTSYNI